MRKYRQHVKHPKHAKYDIKRGRHKKRASREERVWNQEHLVPDRPCWMDLETYRKLARLRETL